MTKHFYILLLIAFSSCGFFEKEFSYDIYSQEEFVEAELEHKESNFAYNDITELKFSNEGDKIRTVAYLSTSGGTEYDPIIKFEKGNLILSAKLKPEIKELNEEKVFYALYYNIELKANQKINKVYFIAPNYIRNGKFKGIDTAK